MAIDFPGTPADGDVFTVGNRSWTFSTAAGVWTGSFALTPYEGVSSLSFASNVLTCPIPASSIAYVATAPTASWTVNYTGLDTTDGRVYSTTLFITQGATGYGPTTFQIAGASQTVKWAGGGAPTPTSSAGKIDVYSFTLIRLSAAWTVLGTATVNF